MTPLRRLAVVASLQVLILLSVVGFKQYTAWTADTVVLRAATTDPQALLRPGGITYEISSIDLSEVAGDDELWDRTVYVELREGKDGAWEAVAIHDGHESTYDGTRLIKGKLQREYYPVSNGVVQVQYGIEDVFIAEDRADALPSGADHAIRVEVKVDRFGDPSPSRFLVDGEEFDLERR